MKAYQVIVVLASAVTLVTPSAYADRTGTRVYAQVNGNYKPEVRAINPNNMMVQGSSNRRERNERTPRVKNVAENVNWYYLEVPVKFFALEPDPRERGEMRAIPHGTVDELEANFYLAVTNPAVNEFKNSELTRADQNKLIVLEKTLKYVDVPVGDPKKHQIAPETKTAVFLSPATVGKLTGGHPEKLKEKLVAFAVVFRYNGANCRLNPETSSSTRDKNYLNYCWDSKRSDSFIKKTWWQSTSSALPRMNDYKLRSIAETPFAARYTIYGYPAVSPMYGSSSASESSAASATSADTEKPSPRKSEKSHKSSGSESNVPDAPATPSVQED